MPGQLKAKSTAVPGSLYRPAGVNMFNRAMTARMLTVGREIRDYQWTQYPILAQAINIFLQKASGREARVSGKIRPVQRAIEYLNSAVTFSSNGITEYGLEQFIRRRALDYLCIGRTAYYWDEEMLRYIDPTEISYDQEKRVWRNHATYEEYKPERIVINHPLPIGSGGLFASPIASVIPSAMLHWLVQQHDMASIDGRKMREGIVVRTEALADQIIEALPQIAQQWSEPDPTSNNVYIFYVDDDGNTAVGDMFARLGLSNIPDGFDRYEQTLKYVNEIGGATGQAIKEFWTDSKVSSNRSIEDVEQQRQTVKGPAAFVKTEERLYNQDRMMRQFHSRTRMAFYEEVDATTRKTNAEVIKSLSEAVERLIGSVGLKREAVIAWLQSRGELPGDIDIVDENFVIKPLEQSADTIDPEKKETTRQVSPESTPTSHKSIDPDIDYDEIVMSLNGDILEKRIRLVSFEKIIEQEIAENPPEPVPEPNFHEAVLQGRREMEKRFFSMDIKEFPEDVRDMSRIILDKSSETLEPEDYHTIARILSMIDHNKELQYA